ncbi:3788_t:CDS:2 [Entrophospora sp. SA101]|nr:3788_t:CDS:2 [Entrophospora sp. SA101]
MTRPRFFTGIQATGTLTLGHYLGVINHILLLQEEYEVIVMIADLHALTVPQQGMDYRKKAADIAALLYACEKKKGEETGNLALLAYPVLMSADIFLYDADLVIVGQDQQQHCELTAAIARKFNNFYQAELLKLPQFAIPQLGGKIMGLQNPEKKMSKSENDHLALLDEPEIVKKKIQRAETDSENKVYYDPIKKTGISNLLLIYALFKKVSPQEAEKEVSNLNYHQFKTKLAELVCAKFQIIQEKFPIYQAKITGLLEKNQHYCQKLAQQKLKEIKNKMKLPN